MKPSKPDYTIRTMLTWDLPACHILKEQLIWNQTFSDWKRFLSYNPEGCFVAVAEEKIIGTVCTIAYEDKFGWVAMVIVDQEFHRMGIGKALLHAGIEHLRNRGLTVKLDATPEGKLLYDSLGFVDEYKAARYAGKHLTLDKPALECEPVTAADWDEIEIFDREVFGASRRMVLESYFQGYPQYSFLVRVKGKIEGYITARDGSFAFHPGPWVARSPEIAKNLFLTVIHQRKTEDVYVDALDQNAAVTGFLQEIGFTIQRPLIRMYLGENNHPGKPEWVCGISGPELG